MLVDERIKVLAHNLVSYSCAVQPGEKVLIEATGADYQLVNALIDEIYKAGGYPVTRIYDNRIKKATLMGLNASTVELMRSIDEPMMAKMDAYIAIRGGNNAYELSDVPSENMHLYETEYMQPIHHGIRVPKTKWVVLRYPTEGMSQMFGMSTEAFEDFYFEVCNFDYARMAEAMTPLVDLMNRTDKVRLVAPDTDLTFSIKDIPAVKCSGRRNIPDGEVYTAPVKNSANGVIHYNAPTVMNGTRFTDMRLVFKDGKIVEATSSNTALCNEIFDTDAGSRYVGEFAIGVNPYVKHPMGDILFDEKISGSIHFTPGACYKEAPNGNVSAVHWDLVLVQTEEYGGGEIYFDDVLIRKNGRFVLPELDGLNPENLM